tara:strand:+ start:2882 stop:3118 length:237 start_codon:yes stop_codon:yes gene_type:complete
MHLAAQAVKAWAMIVLKIVTITDLTMEVAVFVLFDGETDLTEHEAVLAILILILYLVHLYVGMLWTHRRIGLIPRAIR